MNNKMTNWKTTTAFTVFILLLTYAIITESSDSVVSSLTFLCGASWLVLKASSDTFTMVLKNLSENFKGGGR